MNIIKVALPVLALTSTINANAALIDRGNGMIYDTDLDVTWMQDANYAMTSGYDSDGLMSWSQAMTWADQLSFGGYSDWRLATSEIFDGSCSIQPSFIGTPYGYNCSGSEMGHLYYSEFQLTADTSVDDPSSALDDIFTNLQTSDYYWSSTTNDAQLLQQQAGTFNFLFGWQQYVSTDNEYYAWALRDGDVAAVPVPAAIWLFGSGLLGLMGAAWRKKS